MTRDEITELVATAADPDGRTDGALIALGAFAGGVALAFEIHPDPAEAGYVVKFMLLQLGDRLRAVAEARTTFPPAPAGVNQSITHEDRP